VNVATLDSLIDEFGVPDYAKIDVEGFDLEVLRGLSRPIPLLSFEYNSQSELIRLRSNVSRTLTDWVGTNLTIKVKRQDKHPFNLTSG
jgi:hypothetical protein